jgi:hypothetical protein
MVATGAAGFKDSAGAGAEFCAAADSGAGADSGTGADSSGIFNWLSARRNTVSPDVPE